ncbi:MAG TPA: ATP-binding protein [Candidatus Limnocylindria bacterium]|nr:ATP-binding protein [Candidatus Limnocylindria bacterium]
MATRDRLDELAPSAVIDALDAGVLVARADGSIVRANPALLSIYGISEIPPTMAALRDVLSLTRLDGTPAGPEWLGEVARSGEGGAARFRFRRPSDGRDGVIESRAAPLRGPDGRVAGLVVAVQDVTGEVEAAREREEFLSLVSHELKTPLTPLKALAQLIRSRTRRSREGGALDIGSLERNLATIERQVDRMNALVNDLLEVSRAGRGTFQLHLAEIDLARIVRDVSQRYVDAAAEEGRHRFEVAVPERLAATGDQTRLEQVVWDLIGNAVKFSPRGGAVRVRLRADDRAAVLTIEDEGVGIVRSLLPTVGRRPFVRPGGGFAGMGIGIYFSRVVAEGHGGTLELESEGEGKGTTVTLRLPAR